MSNPTSNFGWQMPTATDLVTDLPADFEVFGQAVDTSLADLKGGTTGQVLTKASNTNMDFTWTAIDPLVILDAKGDLITATAADTPARLAVGTNDQVLMADSSTATGLKWGTVAAGGMTVIASGSLSGSTVSLTGISGTYKDLILVMNNYSFSSNAYPLVGFNSLGSGCAQGAIFRYFGSSPTNAYDFINPFGSRALDAAYNTGLMYIRFQNYTATTPKTFYAASTGFDVSAGGLTFGYQFGFLDSNTAVSSIQMMASSGAFDAGTYILYGVS